MDFHGTSIALEGKGVTFAPNEDLKEFDIKPLGGRAWSQMVSTGFSWGFFSKNDIGTYENMDPT